MQILVDADACPVKKIILSIAKQRNIPVTMIIDTSHIINDGYSSVITVDTAKDSVDIALINILKKDDIVVTQDYGVAAMAIGKGAKAVNQNGLIYTNDNIDRLLLERHVSKKARLMKKRCGTMKKRTKEDDVKFEESLIKLL